MMTKLTSEVTHQYHVTSQFSQRKKSLSSCEAIHKNQKSNQKLISIYYSIISKFTVYHFTIILRPFNFNCAHRSVVFFIQ